MGKPLVRWYVTSATKLQRNTSLAITSGSKVLNFERGFPHHRKSKISSADTISIYLNSSVQNIHLLDQDGGCRSPELRLFSKRVPWATTWPLRAFTYSWSLEISGWSRSQQLLLAARFVSRYPLSPNPGIASTRYRCAHLTTLKIDSNINWKWNIPYGTFWGNFWN